MSLRALWMRLRPCVRRLAAAAHALGLLARHPAMLHRRLDEIRLVRASPLIDPGFYRFQYADVARTGVDPVLHYVAAGGLDRRDPSPLFDTSYYLEGNPDVAGSGVNPLVHYIQSGAREGRDPHPLFDTSFYLEGNPDVAGSGVNPLAHYLQSGAQEGHDPHPLFDTSFYLESSPDVAGLGVNPLAHYLQFGAQEGRDPHPLFDTSFYLESSPDAAGSGVNPLAHYLQSGAREGYDPHPLFDTSFYLESSPDAAQPSVNPLAHYASSGAREGLSPHPLFDPAFYLAQYPDVRQSGIDPFIHFLRVGAFEQRDPNPLFDTSFYLDRYPDVRGAGINPLEHYARVGVREGRDPGPFFCAALYRKEFPMEGEGDPLAHLLRSLPKDADARETPFAYRSWLAAYDPASRREPIIVPYVQQRQVTPRFSLIVATSPGVVPAHLRETVGSACTQTNESWELLVAFPVDLSREGRRSLETLSAKDPRIRLVQATTAESWLMHARAAAASHGDFLAFLGEGDVLDRGALSVAAAALERQPDLLVLYSDEDRLDENGRRCDPHFKPDWSRDLFHGWNYLGRLALIEADLVAAAGGVRGTHAPSHEYDLLLRVISRAGDLRVGHVRQVLCHRRSSDPGPRGRAPTVEEAASATRALEESLACRGVAATVRPIGDRLRRVVFPLPERAPRVSIIVPTRDHPRLLDRCLTSLERTDYPEFEVLVVDNDSREPETLRHLRSLPPRHHVVGFEGDFNFPAIVNFGVARSGGEVIVLLNDDTEVVHPSWLREMVRLVLRPDVGAVGAKLSYPNGTVQHAGVIVGLGGVAGHPFVGSPRSGQGYFGRLALTQEYSAVSAACLAMRRSVFAAVGGLDREAFPVNFNDVDLCLRIRALGLKVLYCAQAEFVHHESASRRWLPQSHDRLAAERRHFFARWASVARDDPFYNPNLSLDGAGFTLAVPPRDPATGEGRPARGG